MAHIYAGTLPLRCELQGRWSRVIVEDEVNGSSVAKRKSPDLGRACTDKVGRCLWEMYFFNTATRIVIALRRVGAFEK